MFTDVVGYSTISEKDENLALHLLDEHRRLLQSVFPKFGGDVVKTMGDGFLVEFASAVKAVECAVEVQREMRRLNSTRKPNEKVLLRVGVHVGDIVHTQGDILGDAVNVAARVESLAEPGGICVTRQVVDQVKRKVGCQMVKVGLRELKNIRTPVEVYRIVLPQEMAPQSGGSVLDRRRIAILPLANLSADPNDRYFTDGMTEELISTVSKIKELSVISRTSIMRYRDTAVSIGQIGEELGVGTVLEGSVRKSGNRLRIAAQLIEVEGDRHVWSQSYDRDLTDVFAIQSDIAEQVAKALEVQLLSKEKASIEKKATKDLEAYTLYLKGRYYWNERSEDGNKRATKHFEEAIKADPSFAMAYSGLADCYIIFSNRGWMSPAQAAPLAKANAMKALELDNSLAEAHASLGLIQSNFFWDLDASQRELRRALELNPNYAIAYHWLSIVLEFVKKYEEAFEIEKRGKALDPYSRVISYGIGSCLLYLRRTEEAIEQYKKVIDLNPDFAPVYSGLSRAYLTLSKYNEAIEAAKKAVELDRASSEMKLELVEVYAASGQREMARKLLDEVLTSAKKAYTSPTSVGIALFHLGRKDEALKWLEEAYEERDSGLLYFRSFPWLEEYRSDPRWLEIERKMGLSKGS